MLIEGGCGGGGGGTYCGAGVAEEDAGGEGLERARGGLESPVDEERGVREVQALLLEHVEAHARRLRTHTHERSRPLAVRLVLAM